MTCPERQRKETVMVYTYSDNGDLIVVIKDAKSIPHINELVGDIILAATEEPAEQADDAELEPELPVINDDATFGAVAADFKKGRYNGELRAKIAEILNGWVKDRFGCMDEKDRYVRSLDSDGLDAFFVNYSSLISEKKRERAVEESRCGTWDIFLAKGSEEQKKDLILDVISKF